MSRDRCKKSDLQEIKLSSRKFFPPLRPSNLPPRRKQIPGRGTVEHQRNVEIMPAKLHRIERRLTEARKPVRTAQQVAREKAISQRKKRSTVNPTSVTQQKEIGRSKIKVLPLTDLTTDNSGPLRPDDWDKQAALRPSMLQQDEGTPFPKPLLKHFRDYKESCALIRSMGRDFNAVVRYLVQHQRIDYKTLDWFDQTNTLSHYLLLQLTEFERSLLGKGFQLPNQHVEQKEPTATTDAEVIVDFSQEQYRLAREQRSNIRARKEDNFATTRHLRRQRPRRSMPRAQSEEMIRTRNANQDVSFKEQLPLLPREWGQLRGEPSRFEGWKGTDRHDAGHLIGDVNSNLQRRRKEATRIDYDSNSRGQHTREPLSDSSRTSPGTY